MPILLPAGKQQFVSVSGAPLVAGRLYTYEAGSTTPKPTYVDEAGLSANTNPVILDSRGEAVLFGSGKYKLELRDAANNLLWTVDNVGGTDTLVSDILALLANSTDLLKGSSLIGYGSRLEYLSGAGAALNAFGRVVQGADNTGVVISTAALRAQFDYCIPRGLSVVLQGNYLVDGPISDPLQIAAGSLHIECVGDVNITVWPGATAFTTLLSCYTTAINNSTKRGGRLTINLNDKVSNGVYLRHAGGDGGIVDWGGITVLNARENSAVSVNENQGLLVYGRYESVTMESPKVRGVTRVNPAGACKGISISEFVGEVNILGPMISNIFTGGGAADADGIAAFGRQLNGQYGRRAGRLLIRGGMFSECQGRSVKLQVSDALLDRLNMEHQMVVTVSGADIDAQVGGSIVIRSPIFTYRLNGATTPIGAGFYPVSLQQQCTDAPNDMQIVDSMVRTEVTMTRFAFITVGATSAVGVNNVEGLQVQPLGALATSAFTRTVVEFDAGQVAASSNPTHVGVRDTRANMSGIPLIGHTGFGASVATKLSFEAVGNENTGAASASTNVIAAVSGSPIAAYLRFMLRDNPNINDFLSFSSFDYRTLPVGCRFLYDIASVTAINGPGLGATGIASVEVLNQLNATAGSRSIRVVKDNATVAATVFQTQTGTWGQIK